MAVIKPKSKFDSFNLAPEGRHVFVFNGEVVPTTNGSYRFVCEYENDPSAKVSIFGGCNNLGSMEALMGIILCSGVGDRIRKKKPNLPDPKDGWDESMLKNEALVEQLKVDIKGCKIELDIKHQPRKWTDAAGVEQSGFNARCQEMFECGDSGGKKETETVAVDFDG